MIDWDLVVELLKTPVFVLLSGAGVLAYPFKMVHTILERCLDYHYAKAIKDGKIDK